MLKYSIPEIPSWVQNSDVQTVQWLNNALSKLWPSVSSATEAVIKATLSPVLEQNCPVYLTSLTFSRITLGTIAPVIVGIRHCQTEDNCVRLDVELKWAGNPEVFQSNVFFNLYRLFWMLATKPSH
jgi:Ca2+-dependent lipid-binding protein